MANTPQLRSACISVSTTTGIRATKAKKSRKLTFLEIDYFYADDTSEHIDVIYDPRKKA
jgi:hypothetical protein